MNSQLETLIVARALCARAKLTTSEAAAALRRFSPPSASDADWRDRIESTISSLRDRGVLDGENLLADPAELARRIGRHEAKRWPQLADRILPALALGIAPHDHKIHKKLASRDDWAAAIVARALGLWSSGPPPSLSAVCDEIAWRDLGLSGKPKRLPAEVRALFVQRRLTSDAAPPERQIRLLAAREIEAPRAELRALRDALVRRWLEGRSFGTARSFADEVALVAREARQGLFGDRKLFISAAWEALRARPAVAPLTLDEFKSKLLAAHRAGDLVLARADLVAAMDPALVAASEIRTDGASFHFIVRGEAT